MATSNSSDFNLTRNEIIEEAFREIGVKTPNRTLTAEEMNDGARTLNLYIKYLISQGFFLWKTKQATLFVASNQSSYIIDGSTANCTEEFIQTTTTSLTASGSLLIEVESITGFVESYFIGLVQDNNTIHWSTINRLGEDTDYIEDFASATGLTFDSSIIEVTGGVAKLKSQRPTDSTFGATYTSVIDGSFGDGVLTGTGFGSPVITGNQLDLDGAVLKYVDYDGTGNANTAIQTGAIKFKLTPNYTGVPTANKTFVAVSSAAGSSINLISLTHVLATGDISLSIFDSGGILINGVLLSGYSPTAGVEDEIELNWDITGGATQLFINGVQLGSTALGTGTRSSLIGLIRIGSDQSASDVSDFKIDDFVIFDTVQHTTGYTPGYTLPETDFVLTNPILDIDTAVTGDIKGWNSFTTLITAAGLDEVTFIESDDAGSTYQYWNGSAWVLSNNTITDSNNTTDINSNISAFPITTSGMKIRLFLHSEDGSTTPSIDNLDINYGVGEVVYINSITTNDSASGSNVYVYETKINRPENIQNAQSTLASNSEIPMVQLSRDTYYNIPVKATPGRPNQFYYNKQLNSGIINLWPVPDSITNRIVMSFIEQIFDFDSATDDPDFPIEWLQPIILNVAYRLSRKYGRLEISEKEQLKRDAEETLEEVTGFDREETSIRFEPATNTNVNSYR